MTLLEAIIIPTDAKKKPGQVSEVWRCTLAGNVTRKRVVVNDLQPCTYENNLYLNKVPKVFCPTFPRPCSFE